MHLFSPYRHFGEFSYVIPILEKSARRSDDYQFSKMVGM